MSTQLLTNQKECSIAAAAFDVIFTMGYFQLIYPTFKIPGGMWLCGAQSFLWILEKSFYCMTLEDILLKYLIGAGLRAPGIHTIPLLQV